MGILLFDKKEKFYQLLARKQFPMKFQFNGNMKTRICDVKIKRGKGYFDGSPIPGPLIVILFQTFPTSMFLLNRRSNNAN